MKLAWKLLFYVLCVNAGIYMVSELLDISVSLTPYNIEQIEGAYNATEIVDSWEYGDSGLYGDVQAGLNFFWSKSGVLINGVFILLGNMGAPAEITFPLQAIWAMLWFTFVIEIITGRNITGS